MNPRLAALAGPLRPSVLPLAGERISIGRSRSNHVCLGSSSVSREHCFIEREADRFGITDLDSLNGTFVNGVPVKKRTLEHGDQVRIGDCVFVFLLRDPEPQEPPPSVELTDVGPEPGTTVELPADGPSVPAIALERSPRLDRLQRDFDALLRFSAEVNSIRRTDVILRQVLGSLLEIIPARRGALLLAGRDGGNPVPVAGLDRSPGETRAVPVSRTITRRVLRERIAILSNNAGEDGLLGPSDSGVLSRARSLIAVPLLSGKRSLGVIYLDSGDPAVRFDEDHLKLLTAMANVTAVALESARLFDSLHDQNQRLRIESRQGHEMIGESSAMQRVREFVTRVASSDTTVLITGESGTGKEVLAREIVAGSPRAGKPLEAINCAALVESLLESELFGHERGAFTGAVAQKKGKLEVADGGTVFLDEVGELTGPLQAKLLRALQSREFTRLGGTRPVTVDIRVLAASNRDLAEAVRSRSFRKDLYYRLNVITIDLPPLRERRDDILLLASYFLDKHGDRCKRRLEGISDAARNYLLRYDWPGNVRELENAIERAVVLGSSERIRPEDLPEAVIESAVTAGSSGAKFQEAVLKAKKKAILEAFRQSGGGHAEAARILGIHPIHLHRLIRNLGLKGALKAR